MQAATHDRLGIERMGLSRVSRFGLPARRDGTCKVQKSGRRRLPRLCCSFTDTGPARPNDRKQYRPAHAEFTHLTGIGPPKVML